MSMLMIEIPNKIKKKQIKYVILKQAGVIKLLWKKYVRKKC